MYRQFVLKLAAIAVCCLFPVAAGAASYEQLRHLYDYNPQAPLDLKESGVSTRDGIQVHEITYASPMGGRVPASLFVPPGKGPFAAMIFMHGGNGNRGQLVNQALSYAKMGAVCLTLDAALHGERALPNVLLMDYTAPERTRDAYIQTVVDMRRGVDLLLARRDVDPKRLGYSGGSFGALVGGVLAGVEHRIKAYALSSGLTSINDALIPSVTTPIKEMPKPEIDRSRAIVDAASAIYYIGHAAPAALLLQNGEKDTGITKECADRWHQTASEPKTIRWYDGGHGLTPQAAQDRAEWLKGQLGLK